MSAALRIHLDIAHDVRPYGNDDDLVELHRMAHDRQVAANLIADRLATAPPAVVERVLGDRSMYLADANGTVYLAEPVDPRHMPTVGPLYRLTEQVDVLAASKASLAATAAWLDAHPAPGEESGSAGRRPSPGAPSGSTCSGGAS